MDTGGLFSRHLGTETKATPVFSRNGGDNTPTVIVLVWKLPGIRGSLFVFFPSTSDEHSEVFFRDAHSLARTREPHFSEMAGFTPSVETSPSDAEYFCGFVPGENTRRSVKLF